MIFGCRIAYAYNLESWRLGAFTPRNFVFPCFPAMLLSNPSISHLPWLPLAIEHFLKFPFSIIHSYHVFQVILYTQRPQLTGQSVSLHLQNSKVLAVPTFCEAWRPSVVYEINDYCWLYNPEGDVSRSPCALHALSYRAVKKWTPLGLVLSDILTSFNQFLIPIVCLDGTEHHLPH